MTLHLRTLSTLLLLAATLFSKPLVAQTTEPNARPLDGPVIQRIKEKQSITIAYDPNQAPFP